MNWTDPGERLPDFDEDVVAVVSKDGFAKALVQLSASGKWVDQIWRSRLTSEPITYDKIYGWKPYTPGDRW
jgi:hypothetical protein